MTAGPSRSGPVTVHAQSDRSESPWPLAHRVRTALWLLVSLLLFRPTPKFFNKWRLFLLRRFGAQIPAHAFVDASARIRYPWHLAMDHRACIGAGADIYNLAPIHLQAGCTVAQQAYLCAGTHDLEDPALPLVTAPIIVGENAFIGVRALILPGVRVHEGGVVGGGAVVTKDVPPWTVVAGNPAAPIGTRRPIPGVSSRTITRA